MGNAYRAVSGVKYHGHRGVDRRHCYLRCVGQPCLCGRRANCASLGHTNCHAAPHFHTHLHARDVADGHGHTHANAHANADSHLDPIAHAHTLVDRNAKAYRHRRADSDAAAYHHAHSGAINQHTHVAPATISDSHAGSANQHTHVNLVADADTSAAHFHADTYFYTYAATDGYPDADSHFHTIANIQALGHGNQPTQKTVHSDGYGAGHRVAHVYAQPFTDSYAACHNDQHAKPIANFNLYLYANGGS